MELPFAGTWNHGAPPFWYLPSWTPPVSRRSICQRPIAPSASSSSTLVPQRQQAAVTAGDAVGKRHSFLVQVDVVWFRKGSPYLRAVRAIDAWGKR